MTTTQTRPAAAPKAKHHPTVVAEAERRSANVQLAIADKITTFAGSMMFVYAHALIFTAWMLFVEKSPWQTLTLIVSLEAIFLSTFVMIGQNRQASFQQAKADRDFGTNEEELHTNTELTRMIHDLTQQIHEHILGNAAQSSGSTGPSSTGPSSTGPSPASSDHTTSS